MPVTTTMSSTTIPTTIITTTPAPTTPPIKSTTTTTVAPPTTITSTNLITSLQTASALIVTSTEESTAQTSTLPYNFNQDQLETTTNENSETTTNENSETTTLPLVQLILSGKYHEINPGQYHEVNPGQYHEVNPGQYQYQDDLNELEQQQQKKQQQQTLQQGRGFESAPLRTADQSQAIVKKQKVQSSLNDVQVEVKQTENTKIYNVQSKVDKFIIGEYGTISKESGQTLQGVRYTALADVSVDPNLIYETLIKFFPMHHHDEST